MGSGYFVQEHQVYGIPFPTTRERAQRLEEAIQVIRMLWTQESASFQGAYYQLDNAPFVPKPVQQPHPPIMIGGMGEKLTFPIVAKYADMWNAAGLTPQQLAQKIAILEGIEKTYITSLYLRDDPAEVQALLEQIPRMQGLSAEQARATVLAGDVAAVRQQIQAYVNAGATHFILILRRPGFYDREGIRLFAKEIMPHFRTGS